MSLKCFGEPKPITGDVYNFACAGGRDDWQSYILISSEDVFRTYWQWDVKWSENFVLGDDITLACSLAPSDLIPTSLSTGTFSGTFSGNSLEAEVGSYGKINLKGSAQVASAAVRVSSGAVFSAPELRVADYDLTVSNYAKADVWCSGTLRINASTAARITYDGPCRVESLTDNIRRRK